LFVMWEEFFRGTLHALAAPVPSEGLGLVEVYFWIGRELVWWWLVSGLASLVLAYLRRLPLIQDSIAALCRFGALAEVSPKSKPVATTQA
jgi:hypothetical protein